MRLRSFARIAAIAVFAVAFGVLEHWTAQSFAVHMTQHMALMVVLAPLLVIGWAPSRPPRAICAVWFAIAAVAAQTIGLVVWHLPGPFDAAEANSAVHVLEHITLLATATAAWWVIIASPVATSVRFAACVGVAAPMMLLGVFITLAPAPWYPSYAQPLGLLSPLVDQQTGGAIMWGPAGIAYVIAAAWLVASAISADERFADARNA